jgi:hypothetical protein
MIISIRRAHAEHYRTRVRNFRSSRHKPTRPAAARSGTSPGTWNQLAGAVGAHSAEFIAARRAERALIAADRSLAIVGQAGPAALALRPHLQHAHRPITRSLADHAAQIPAPTPPERADPRRRRRRAQDKLAYDKPSAFAEPSPSRCSLSVCPPIVVGRPSELSVACWLLRIVR